MPVAAPVKLSLREDGDWVRAYFAAADNSWREEVASFAIGVLQRTPGVFEKWKDALSQALTHFLEAKTGQKVIEVKEVPLLDQN